MTVIKLDMKDREEIQRSITAQTLAHWRGRVTRMIMPPTEIVLGSTTTIKLWMRARGSNKVHLKVLLLPQRIYGIRKSAIREVLKISNTFQIM